MQGDWTKGKRQDSIQNGTKTQVLRNVNKDRRTKIKKQRSATSDGSRASISIFVTTAIMTEASNSNFSSKLKKEVLNVQAQLICLLLLIEENKKLASVDETDILKKFQTKIQNIEAEIFQLKDEFFSTTLLLDDSVLQFNDNNQISVSKVIAGYVDYVIQVT